MGVQASKLIDVGMSAALYATPSKLCALSMRVVTELSWGCHNRRYGGVRAGPGRNHRSKILTIPRTQHVN